MSPRAATVAAAETAPHFGEEALAFLRGLEAENTKPWFEAHRAQYEQALRAPMLALVEAIDARLGDLAPELVGDRRRSMFRIHRDVRFSKDKRPYKTNAACWFFHRDVGRGGGDSAGGTVHGGAGFYFHLQPGNTFVGGGLWMPPRPALNQIRERLAERTAEWEEIVDDAAFRRRFGALDEEGMLVRLPRGYASDHPAARWLRYQSFTAGRALDDAAALDRRLVDRLVADFERLLPMVRWLNRALGLQPATRR